MERYGHPDRIEQHIEALESQFVFVFSYAVTCCFASLTCVTSLDLDCFHRGYIHRLDESTCWNSFAQGVVASCLIDNRCDMRYEDHTITDDIRRVDLITTEILRSSIRNPVVKINECKVIVRQGRQKTSPNIQIAESLIVSDDYFLVTFSSTTSCATSE